MSVRIKQGDLLNAKEDYIVHQCNCYTVNSHGLSKAIGERYPWADYYRTRTRIGSRNFSLDDKDKFGKIKIINNPDEEIGGGVICMFAQLCPGKPLRFRTYPNWEIDTEEERFKRFKSCLKKLGKWAQGITLAFPWRIGCGLAGGIWTRYFAEIEKFAAKYNIDVTIYKLSSHKFEY